MAEVMEKPAKRRGKRNNRNDSNGVEPEPAQDSRQFGRKDPLPKVTGFFDRCAGIPLADWGTRAKVTIYRLEPLINALVGSEKKYIRVYTQPPVTEERIKQDCGSGRYRLYLNFKAPAQNEREVDSVEIDILDMHFPPKIPKGAWLEDPRNQQWAWAKETYDKQNGAPATQQPQANTAETILDALEMADRLRPPVDPLAMLKAAQELLPKGQDAGVTGFMAFMQSELAGLRQQVEKSRDREIALLEKLSSRDQSNGKPLSGVKDILNEVKEVFGVTSLKDLINGGKEIGVAVQKSRLAGWQEFVLALAPAAKDIISPFAGIFLQSMLMKGQGGGIQSNPGLGGVPALPNATGAAPPAMMPFLQMIAMPLQNKIRQCGPPDNSDPAELGDEFAYWVQEGFGADPKYFQAMLAIKAMGPVGLIAALRSVPAIWNDKGPTGTQPSLAELEQQLSPFFTAFLAGPKPTEESDDEPIESDPAQPEVLTFSEA